MTHTITDEEYEELQRYRSRERHVQALVFFATEALAKLDSLSRYVVESLRVGLRESLAGVRDLSAKDDES